MIVKCIALYNENTNQYINSKADGFLAIGFHYNVLEILITKNGIDYRLLADSSGAYGHPFMVRSQDFQIVSFGRPDNWIINNQKGRTFLEIAPAKWADDSLWIDSFWEEYGNSTPRALDCFEEELITILKADKEYVNVMINERLNLIYPTWHESMSPIFEKVIEED